MTKAIRVGLVGAKLAARFHFDGFRRVYGVPVEVVGVTSRTADARDAFARSKGIRSFETFEEMCALVDVVDLCTPPSSHEHLAVQALEQGKHVIIEKPLTGYFGSGAQGFRSTSSSPMARLRTSSPASWSSVAFTTGSRSCVTTTVPAAT
jgi:Oxidoreductase family, NAD-binding Rossmann fold